MSFDKWYREVGYLGDDQNTRVKIAYEAGQQSKQDEVDELQKRIDEALKFANDAHSDLNIGMLKMVDILKGDQS